jgi:hypothetical protein
MEATMQSIILLPVPILVPVTPPPAPPRIIAGNGWIRCPRVPRKPQPRPEHWPPKQSIPTPPARESLEQVRRQLAERREARVRQIHAREGIAAE